MKTGLTRNESQLYCVLLKEGEKTGYEAAKISGISRGNAYQSLAGLVDKGGAYICEGIVQKFVAVPIQEYCKNVINRTIKNTQSIIEKCPVMREPDSSYITITGFENILDKMKNLIEFATRRIYVSISHSDLSLLENTLQMAVKRGLKVVVITSFQYDFKGVTVYTTTVKDKHIRLIADSKYVLTGEILGTKHDKCLYSCNKQLVELIKDSLKNEIKLAEIGI
jgi:sugar-specific transcriptional regulator TrmB